jgi:hypothetical protein
MRTILQASTAMANVTTVTAAIQDYSAGGFPARELRPGQWARRSLIAIDGVAECASAHPVRVDAAKRARA